MANSNNPKTWDFDLHMHSHHSFDSAMSRDCLIQTAKKRGLSGIAIADHQSFAFHQEMNAPAEPNFFIIPAMEIGTEKGDIIGLFLKQEIKSRQSSDVIREIRDQGGLVLIPHPFKRKRFIDFEFLKKADLIEGWNARVNDPREDLNTQARQFAETNQIAWTAASDAHFPEEIGRARIRLAAAPRSLEDIKQALQSREFTCEGSLSSIYAEPRSQMLAFFKTLRWRFLVRSLRSALSLTVRKLTRSSLTAKSL